MKTVRPTSRRSALLLPLPRMSRRVFRQSRYPWFFPCPVLRSLPRVLLLLPSPSSVGPSLRLFDISPPWYRQTFPRPRTRPECSDKNNNETPTLFFCLPNQGGLRGSGESKLRVWRERGTRPDLLHPDSTGGIATHLPSLPISLLVSFINTPGLWIETPVGVPPWSGFGTKFRREVFRDEYGPRSSNVLGVDWVSSSSRRRVTCPFSPHQIFFRLVLSL